MPVEAPEYVDEGALRAPAPAPLSRGDDGASCCAAGAAGSDAAGGVEAASGSAAVPDPVPDSAPTFVSRQETNWLSSLSETSCITPRPNWAGLPVMLRSVATLTSVALPPESFIVAVTSAPAVPLPRLSLPLASTTNLPAAWSFSTK